MSKKDILLEACVNSVESAIAAELGGADRVELCDNLFEGGTTPSAASIELARKNISIDLNVIIRPRGGDFCYTDMEFSMMKKNIEISKQLGVKGIVIGLLLKNGDIDTKRTKELIEIASPMSVNFHRAFDMCRDPIKALNDLIDLKIDRLLTSGLKNTAMEGVDIIKELIEFAGDKIIIMPGSGINEDNILQMIQYTNAKEYHVSARKKIKSKMEFINNAVSMGKSDLSEYEISITDSERIRKIKQICDKANT